MLLAAAFSTLVATLSPPVDILQCTTGTVMSDMLYKTDGSYSIEFVNRESRPVDAVIFDVRLGSSNVPIRDDGKFSPGVVISHRFPHRGGSVVLLGKPSLQCSVLWVRFSDGTEWRRGGGL